MGIRGRGLDVPPLHPRAQGVAWGRGLSPRISTFSASPLSRCFHHPRLKLRVGLGFPFSCCPFSLDSMSSGHQALFLLPPKGLSTPPLLPPARRVRAVTLPSRVCGDCFRPLLPASFSLCTPAPPSTSQLPRQHMDAVYSLLKTPPWLLYCPEPGREQKALVVRPCPPSSVPPPAPRTGPPRLRTAQSACKMLRVSAWAVRAWGLLCSSSGVLETSFKINSNATPAATCSTEDAPRARVGAAFRKQPCPSLPLLVRGGRVLPESCWCPQR